jgi:hypothetical protein
MLLISNLSYISQVYDQQESYTHTVIPGIVLEFREQSLVTRCVMGSILTHSAHQDVLGLWS